MRSLSAYVKTAFPGIKNRFNLSDKFTPELACALAKDVLLSIDECQVVSARPNQGVKELEICPQRRYMDRELSQDDRASAPSVVNAILAGFKRLPSRPNDVGDTK